MPNRRKRSGYQGPAGIFKAPGSDSGYRRINRKGIVSNVTLPEGQTGLAGHDLIRNPFRSGQWSWAQARRAGQGPGVGGGGSPTPAVGSGASPATGGDYTTSPYWGPWNVGWSQQGSQWAPIAGGGYMHMGTGNVYRDGSTPGEATPSYQQSLVDMISSLFEGF